MAEYIFQINTRFQLTNQMFNYFEQACDVSFPFDLYIFTLDSYIS